MYLLKWIFSKKFREQELSKLTDKSIKEAETYADAIDFLIASGSYKERQKYRLPEVDVKRFVQGIRGDLLTMTTVMMIQTHIISKDKRMKKRYDEIYKSVTVNAAARAAKAEADRKAFEKAKEKVGAIIGAERTQNEN